MALRARLAAWARRMLRPPRRILPTRAGLLTLGAPIILGVAAINASNNLLFLLLGASLGLIVLSGLWSERGIAGVDVELQAIGNAHVGEPAKIAATIRRHRRQEKEPSFGLRVRERRMGEKGEKGGQRLDVRVPFIEGASGTVIGLRTFDQRGLQSLRPCEILTTYPFGLLTKARDLDAECTVLVRPREVPVPPALADPLGVAAEGASNAERGLGSDLYGLRERDERDQRARIHALRSARLGREVVIETEAEARPIAQLAVANLVGAEPGAFERTLEIAQATLKAWEQQGYLVGFLSASLWLPPGSATLDGVLDALARLELEPTLSVPEGGGALWLLPAGVAPPALPELGAIAEVDNAGQLHLVFPREAA